MKVRRIDAAQFNTLEPRQISDLLRYGQPGVVDLDKAWDGIAWLISEERRERPYMMPDPDAAETQAIYGTDSLLGGTLFRTSPDKVKQIAAVLEPMSRETISLNFHPDLMSKNEVYPGSWDEEDSLEYLLEAFDRLRRVYLDAAKAGDAIIHKLD